MKSTEPTNIFKLGVKETGQSVPTIGKLNSLTTKKQTTKFSSANFQKMLSPSYIILRIQRLEGKQCKPRRGGSL